MTGDDVLRIYNLFLRNSIITWVDGGWCVDALLGKQTREHPDFDVAVHRKDNAKLRKLLEAEGYQEVIRNDSTDWMYVMKNSEGKEVDVHAFEYDAEGHNIYGIEYPYGSLTGKGNINGQEVNCIAPEWMFKFKTAYEPEEKDLKDVRALASKFGFELSTAYKEANK